MDLEKLACCALIPITGLRLADLEKLACGESLTAMGLWIADLFSFSTVKVQAFWYPEALNLKKGS
jgi:hypothetical protein